MRCDWALGPKNHFYSKGTASNKSNCYLQIVNSELFRPKLNYNWLKWETFAHSSFYVFRPDRFDKSVDFYKLFHRPAFEPTFKAVTIQADAKEENLRVKIINVLNNLLK